MIGYYGHAGGHIGRVVGSLWDRHLTLGIIRLVWYTTDWIWSFFRWYSRMTTGSGQGLTVEEGPRGTRSAFGWDEHQGGAG
jgi:hypothetical protein